MGCAPSTIGEESVSRCKQRKLLVKQVIVARSAFSDAHIAYSSTLLAVAFAFRKYAHGEFTGAGVSTSLKRSVSIPVSDDDEDAELNFLTPHIMSEMEASDDDEVENPMPKQFMHFDDEFGREMKANWWRGLEEISDEFVKCSKCAQEVSRLLEPNRYRLHLKSADNTATIDHAARVMSVITWNAPSDVIEENYELYAKEKEPLALVLFKLLEWEKKLYNDVKAGEVLKLEYQRKLILLAIQKRRGASVELLMKTKADVRRIRTSYIVEMQLIDSTVSEINYVRDRQLYPTLIEIIDGMANMWENMSLHHTYQLRIATDLKSLGISASPTETTLDQYEHTIKLLSVVQGWKIQFKKHTTLQMSYIITLNMWLKINLIPIRNNLKEKLSSSSKRISSPPIHLLLCSWHEHVEKLPYEPLKTAISSFTSTLEAILLLQEEEMKMKEKCEETKREYLRKNNAFDEHNNCTLGRDSVSEKRVVMESLKRRLDEKMEDHKKLCLRVRAKSIRSLRIGLPELLRAASDYAHACADAYNRLMCIALT